MRSRSAVSRSSVAASLVGVARLVRVETELLRQPLRHAFELVDRRPARTRRCAPAALRPAQPRPRARSRVSADRSLAAADQLRRAATTASSASRSAAAASPILDLALVIGLLELARCCASSCAGSFSRSARSAACCSCRSSAPASRCSASAWRLRHSACSRPAALDALAVGRGFARLGRGLGALVGNRAAAVAAALRARFDVLLQRRRIGQSAERTVRRRPRLRAAASSTGSRSACRWASAAALGLDPLQRRRRSVDRPRRFARVALGGERRVPRLLGGRAALLHRAERARRARAAAASTRLLKRRAARRPAAPGGWRAAAARPLRRPRLPRRTRPSAAAARRA